MAHKSLASFPFCAISIFVVDLMNVCVSVCLLKDSDDGQCNVFG